VLNGVVFHTGQVHVHIHPHPDDQTAIRFGAEASFDESLG
jgi:hypothetical protein